VTAPYDGARIRRCKQVHESVALNSSCGHRSNDYWVDARPQHSFWTSSPDSDIDPLPQPNLDLSLELKMLPPTSVRSCRSMLCLACTADVSRIDSLRARTGHDTATRALVATPQVLMATHRGVIEEGHRRAVARREGGQHPGTVGVAQHGGAVGGVGGDHAAGLQGDVVVHHHP